MRRREETVRETDRTCDIHLLVPLQQTLAGEENIGTPLGTGCVGNIETNSLSSRNEMCEMDVWAVFTASWTRKPQDPVPYLPPNSGGVGVITTDEERITSLSRERAVVRDILTEEHRPREPNGSVVGTG